MNRLLGDTERLMKRCQVGVGGRNALDEAHSIMADCYGTLGALTNEIERLRGTLAEFAALVRWECPSLLNEDSGGCARLSMEIDDLLSPNAQVKAHP